jgi:hypothetical protein
MLNVAVAPTKARFSPTAACSNIAIADTREFVKDAHNLRPPYVPGSQAIQGPTGERTVGSGTRSFASPALAGFAFVRAAFRHDRTVGQFEEMSDAIAGFRERYLQL